jgi:hypothetical protein
MADKLPTLTFAQRWKMFLCKLLGHDVVEANIEPMNDPYFDSLDITVKCVTHACKRCGYREKLQIADYGTRYEMPLWHTKEVLPSINPSLIKETP